jgi:hypothetical protein
MAIFNNPYPILSNSKGNFNDVEAEFNCEIEDIELADNMYKIYLKAEIINEPILQKMLEKGEIVFIVSVDSKPFYRKVFKADNNSVDLVTIEMDFQDFSSEFELELTPRLITEEEMNYKNENADSPMNNYFFNLSPKQKLAEHDKIKIVFPRGYKLFETGPLITISKLDSGKKTVNGAFDIKLDNSLNIIVHLEENNFNLIKQMNSVNLNVLSKSLSMSVIYHALSKIKEDKDEFRGLDWAEALHEEYKVFDKLETSEDVLSMTDKILESPLIKMYDHIVKHSD